MSRRTTLRPIEAPPPQTAQTLGARATVAPPTKTSGWPTARAALLAGGVVLIAAVALLGNRSSPTAPSAPAVASGAAVPTPMSSPVVAPVAAMPPATCPAVASFLDVIASYERQARWTLAATTARTALRTPGLCAADRAALGQKLVSLSREALFEQPPPPEDAPGQRRVASAYADLKTLASQYGVQPPAPLPIAQSAYDNRLFLLATVAYADAVTNGDASTQDREVVRAEYAAHYNLGLIWAQRSDVAQRQEGLARLATACRIDERNQLNSPEACNELQILVGPRTRWPAPLAGPFIDAPAHATPTRGV